MAPITWILDNQILERLTHDRRGLPDTIRAAGYEVVGVERNADGSYASVAPRPDECTILFGSHSFVKAVNPDGRFQPGHLGVNERTRASAYMSNLPIYWFLNRDGVFMTWAMFKQRRRDLFYQHDTNMLFLRPDSGFKTFAGQRMMYGTIDHDIETLDKLSGVMDETMCFVNPGIDIQGEFRFVIADKQVIAASEYRWDGKLDIRRDWPQECWDLAQMVADHEWQVDIAYTCDVALTAEGPRIVELNGFSCAGLYACDLAKVVEGVSRAALREWSGLDLE
jgi:hypothetical protein